MNPYESPSSFRYGRRIPDPEQQRDDACEAPKSSGFSLLRRWWIGLAIFFLGNSCIRCMNWGLDLLNVSDWSNESLRRVVVMLSMLVLFVGIPIVTFEAAFFLLVRPWYRQHLSRLTEAKPTEQDNPSA